MAVRSRFRSKHDGPSFRIRSLRQQAGARLAVWAGFVRAGRRFEDFGQKLKSCGPKMPTRAISYNRPLVHPPHPSRPFRRPVPMPADIKQAGYLHLELLGLSLLGWIFAMGSGPLPPLRTGRGPGVAGRGHAASPRDHALIRATRKAVRSLRCTAGEHRISSKFNGL